jgi:hypothetical protein
MNKVENQMGVASYLRHFIANLKHPSGKPRFQMLDGGDSCCLPVVAARLNPELGLHYDDIDFQHALSESHWYVSGYSLGFENPMNERFENLCSDANEATTMFRIVVKSNLTQSLAENLAEKIENIVTILDDMDGGYESIHSKLNDLAIGAKDDIPIEELREFSGSIGDLPTRSLNKSQFIQQSFRKKKQQRTSIIAQNIC